MHNRPEFSREAQRQRFARQRGPEARKKLRTCIVMATALDQKSYGHQGTLKDAFAQDSVGWLFDGVLDALRPLEKLTLEIPAEFRNFSSPRMDLSRVRTYGDAVTVLREAITAAAVTAALN